tara:strand:- start:343 stop:594 length:252 start_codon:yes stop_codon:yes gene_type:complete
MENDQEKPTVSSPTCTALLVLPWDDLCGCVVIPMDDDKLDMIERRVPIGSRENIMKAHYEKHGYFSPNADCETCNGTGDIKAN